MSGRKAPSYWFLLGGASLWCLLIAAPPLLAGSYPLATGALYYFFSRVCHQIPDRSFYWSGYQLAVCHRCAGIYFGFWLGLIFWPLLPAAAQILIRRPRLILIPAAILFCNVLVANGVGSRFATGVMAGFPVALFVWIGIHQLFEPQSRGEFNVSS